MTELLPSWIETSLEELLELIESGSRPRGGVREIRSGIPSIGGEHLNYDGTFNFSSIKYVPSDFAQKMTKGRIRHNDVLIVKDGATTGKTAFVDHSFPFQGAVVNEHVFVCRPTGLISARFLFYYLLSKQGQNQILENFRGSAQGGINLGFAPNTCVALAPAEEQHRIAAKLERLLAKVDRCKERLDRIPTIIKRFRQSILHAACSGELTADWRGNTDGVIPAKDLIDKVRKKREQKPWESIKKPAFIQFDLSKFETNLYEIPENWQWVALANYADCSRGKFSIRPRNDPRYYNGEYPFIQIGDLPKDGGKITSHKQTLNEKGLSISKLFPKDTVAIAIVGATIGNTGILEYDMCFPDSMVGINTGSEVGNVYLEYYLRTEKDKFRTISYSSGGQPNINLETLNPHPFPLPPEDEQKAIVRRVEALFKIADQVEARYQKAKAVVDKLTQSILAKAFRGELVPQDPSDEPASELLKRIREERARRQAK